jgi:hypothetical protein
VGNSSAETAALISKTLSDHFKRGATIWELASSFQIIGCKSKAEMRVEAKAAGTAENP